MMQGRRGEFAFALFLLAVGATVIVGALQVHAPATANVIGPRIAPLAVGIFVEALAAITVGTVWYRAVRDRRERHESAGTVAGSAAVPAGAGSSHDAVSASASSHDAVPPADAPDAPPADAPPADAPPADAPADAPATAPADPFLEGTEAADDDGPVDVATIAWCCAIMVAFGLILTTVGFLIAAFAMFFGLARVLGSRRWVTDLIVSAAVSAALYFGFTDILGVALPAGLI